MPTEDGKRGRPPRLYGSNDALAQPDWGEKAIQYALTHTRFVRYREEDESGDVRLVVHLHRLRPKGVARLISAVLEYADKPLTRQYIESVLTHRYGIAAHTVTKALDILRRRGDAVRWSAPITGREMPFHVYALRDPYPKEKEELLYRFHLHREVFDEHRAAIGYAGESYVYGVLHSSGRFALSAKSDLGFVRLGRRKLDMSASYRANDAVVGISVRNRREVAYPNHKHVRELPNLRDAINGPAVLVAAFLSNDARKALSHDDLGVYVMGRQILPAEITGILARTALRELRGILGPLPVEIVPSTGRFPRESAWTDGIRRDLVELPKLIEDLALDKG